VRLRHASHITVILSKAAHSGPSVCLRARAPCPLRVSCPGTDRAERAAQAAGVSVQCKLQVLALPCLLGSKTILSSESCFILIVRLREINNRMRTEQGQDERYCCLRGGTAEHAQIYEETGSRGAVV
jgi:hypothetical protein